MISGSSNSPSEPSQGIEAFLKGKVPCIGCAAPSASVVYQSQSSSQVKEGISPYTYGGTTPARKFAKEVIAYSRAWDDQTYSYGITQERLDNRDGSPAAYSQGAASNNRDHTYSYDGSDGPCEINTVETTLSEASATLNGLEGGYAPRVSWTGSYDQVFRRVKTYSGEGCTEEDTDVSTHSSGDWSPLILGAATITSHTTKTYSGGASGTLEGASGTGVLSEEITDSMLKGFVNGDIDAAASFIDARFGMSVSKSGYLAPLYRHRYASDAAFTAAKEAREATAQAYLVSQTASRDAAQVELSDAVAALADAEAALVGYDAAKATAENLREELAVLGSERSSKQAKLTYDTTLSEAAQTALQNSIDSLDTSISAKTDEYEDASDAAEAFMLGREDALLAVTSAQYTVDSKTHSLALANLLVAEGNRRVAATGGNTAHTQYTIGSGSSSFTNKPTLGVGDYLTEYEKTVGRYRVQVRADAYTLTEGASFTVTWREQTEDLESGEKTWVERTATATASQGERYAVTGWYSVTPAEGDRVTVVGVAAHAYAEVGADGGSGGSISRDGFVDFSADGALRTFRRIDFSGGFAGSETLPARDYTGHGELGDSPSEDITAAIESAWASWPMGIKARPVQLSGYATPLRVVDDPSSESATVRTFTRVVDGVTDTFTMTLSDEITTADLLDEIAETEGTIGKGSPASSFAQEVFNSEIVSIYTVTDKEVWKYVETYAVTATRPTANTPGGESTSNSYAVEVPVKIGVIDLVTGAVTEETHTVSLTIPAGETSVTSEVFDLDVSEGELKWVKADYIDLGEYGPHTSQGISVEMTVDCADYGIA